MEKSPNMVQWSGKLYVFKGEDGQDHISAAQPTGVSKTHLRAYQLSGPFIPLSQNRDVPVGNALKWLDDLQSLGFKVRPASVD
jgi:hypothetical protein